MPKNLDDPLEQLRRSFDAVGALIAKIRPEQWSAPTPCTDWDVRRVVDHLVGMNRVFAAMLAGDTPPQRRDAAPSEAPEQDFRESARDLLAAFAQPGVLERSYRGPLGSATGADRARIRRYDLLAHGWDLAVATGQSAQLLEAEAEESLEFAKEQVSDDARAGRFAAAQSVPEDASAVERLAAFLGRDVLGARRT